MRNRSAQLNNSFVRYDDIIIRLFLYLQTEDTKTQTESRYRSHI